MQPITIVKDLVNEKYHTAYIMSRIMKANNMLSPFYKALCVGPSQAQHS